LLDVIANGPQYVLEPVAIALAQRCVRRLGKSTRSRKHQDKESQQGSAVHHKLGLGFTLLIGRSAFASTKITEYSRQTYLGAQPIFLLWPQPAKSSGGQARIDQTVKRRLERDAPGALVPDGHLPECNGVGEKRGDSGKAEDSQIVGSGR